MILVLMKLRLNFGDQDLAFRFGVSQSTVSRCVGKWVDNLYVHLKPLIKWPDRDQLLKTMPMDFRKNFKNCVTIIDCFEVFMERPSNLRARTQTWSNYNTRILSSFSSELHHKGQLHSFLKDGADVHQMYTSPKIVASLNIYYLEMLY